MAGFYAFPYAIILAVKSFAKFCSIGLIVANSEAPTILALA